MITFGDSNTERVIKSTPTVLDFYTLRDNNCGMMNADERKIEAGHRLRKARMDAGFEKRSDAIAALSMAYDDKYSYSGYGNYEQGIRPFGPEEAEDFAAVFKCSAAWLLCLSGATPVKPDEIALLDNYRATDDRGKRVISRVAEQERPDYPTGLKSSG